MSCPSFADFIWKKVATNQSRAYVENGAGLKQKGNEMEIKMLDKAFIMRIREAIAATNGAIPDDMMVLVCYRDPMNDYYARLAIDIVGDADADPDKRTKEENQAIYGRSIQLIAMLLNQARNMACTQRMNIPEFMREKFQTDLMDTVQMLHDEQVTFVEDEKKKPDDDFPKENLAPG